MCRQLDIPTTEKWILKLYSCIDMDNFTKYFKNLNINQHKLEWKKFKIYLEKHRNTVDLIRNLEYDE